MKGVEYHPDTERGHMQAELTRLRERVAELEDLYEAARMHVAKGHNDTCSHMLSRDNGCDCGYEIAFDNINLMEDSDGLVALGIVDLEDELAAWKNRANDQARSMQATIAALEERVHKHVQNIETRANGEPTWDEEALGEARACLAIAREKLGVG